MNIEEIRAYCLAKAGVTESFPFDEDTLVFKAGGKMFLLASLDEHSFTAKCNAELAAELREQYDEIKPGYHMNKKLWNTVHTDGSLTGKQLCKMIDHSYELILASLPKKIQAEIAALEQ